MTKRVSQMSLPSNTLRQSALKALDAGAPYADWRSKFVCLDEIEVISGTGAQSAPAELRIGAWNLERGADWPTACEIIEAEQLDVVLLSEMDYGMARTEQVHTTARMAEKLGFHAIFGVEFVELELGSPWERPSDPGVANVCGLHGNAIFSRYPLDKPWLVRFPEADGAWWHRLYGEPRSGGRMAIGATIQSETGPMTVISVHLENNTSPDGRALQLASVIKHLADCDHPIVLGGDLNTSTIDPTQTTDPFRLRTELLETDPHRFIRPMDAEPLFDLLADHGFSRGTANITGATQRTRERGYPRPPLGHIDWLFNKACIAFEPACIAALDRAGRTISDHDLIHCSVHLA